ncbi:hypothetical protein [Streptosporangium sp. NBC_01469]|uniref:hypothetical protein n=1 Tax=Streptosporangium sp. NBC_01469 TaxID=2903898 RepID=UPI002E2803CC|nr:hypothetical protein [Streptosporangium sp. NBC_01469]
MNVIARRVGNMARRREKAWRWEHWGVVPDRETQLALAAELEVSEELLHTQPWPDWLPVGDPIRVDFSWDQSGSTIALNHTLEKAMMDRRGFMRLTGMSLAGFATDWLNVEPAQLVAVLRGGRITEEFVAQIEVSLPRLHTLGDIYGGQQVRKLLDAELGMVAEVLEKSSYNAAIAQRFHGLAAELGSMAGFASFDTGLHSAAQRYWIAAVHSAHTAGDRAVGANILKSMALQCRDFGDFPGSLTIARAAYESAGKVTPRTASMLAMRLAWAHASIGDKAESHRLLSIADTQFGHGTRPDDPRWVLWFDEGEFHNHIGACQLDLGNLRRADFHLDKAREGFSPTRRRDYATYLIRRAHVQNDLGNADHAGDLLHQAVPVIEHAPSQRNISKLLAVRDRLPNGTHRSGLDQRLSTLTG